MFPDYYKDFSCIKGACRHSCCVGWEIDIDEKRIKEYLSIDGTLGEKMKQSISFDGSPHFCLDEREHCPFLNGEGLCQLIIERGQAFLTTICKEHPRFYNELEDRVEGGIGLCCEAAGRLIIGRRRPMRLVYDKEPTTADPIIAKRDLVLAVVADRTRPLKERQKEVLVLCNCKTLPLSTKAFSKILLDLERLDGKWGELLSLYLSDSEKADTLKFEEYLGPRMIEFENLLAYLIYRHFVFAGGHG